MNEKNVQKSFTRYVDEDFSATGIKCGYQFNCEYDEDDGLVAYFKFSVGFINLHRDGELVVVNDDDLAGGMKFDGCLDLHDSHICGPILLDHYVDNLKYLYDVIADEIFGKDSF